MNESKLLVILSLTSSPKRSRRVLCHYEVRGRVEGGIAIIKNLSAIFAVLFFIITVIVIIIIIIIVVIIIIVSSSSSSIFFARNNYLYC